MTNAEFASLLRRMNLKRILASSVLSVDDLLPPRSKVRKQRRKPKKHVKTV